MLEFTFCVYGDVFVLDDERELLWSVRGVESVTQLIEKRRQHVTYRAKGFKDARRFVDLCHFFSVEQRMKYRTQLGQAEREFERKDEADRTELAALRRGRLSTSEGEVHA